MTIRTVLQGLLTCQPCRGDPQEPAADPASQVLRPPPTPLTHQTPPRIAHVPRLPSGDWTLDTTDPALATLSHDTVALWDRTTRYRAPPPRVLLAREKYTKDLQIGEDYRREERGAVGGWHVKYLTADEREAFRLTAQDGRLIDANGQPFNSRYAAGDATRSIFNAAGDNRFAIAVMDQDGNFYANNAALTGKFHHSSFFAGGRVFYGGNIQVTDGWLEAITRSSGHYKTGLEHLDQAVDSMQKQGVVHAFGVYRSVQGAPWQI